MGLAGALGRMGMRAYARRVVVVPGSGTASAPWTPADAPAGKIKGWWDVSDAANRTVTSGDLDSLTDKSGNGIDLFGGTGHVSATKPNVAAGGDYFAMDSAGFDKSHDVLCSTADVVMSQPFAVYQSLAPFASTSNDQTAFDGSNTVLFRTAQGDNTLMFAGSVGFVSRVTNDPKVTRVRYVSSTGYLSVNAGTEASAFVGGNGISGKIRLGDSPTNDAPYHGHIRETVLTSEDVTPGSDLDERLIGYLAWRGGTFETLPSGHTYRYKAPKREITAATVNVTRQPSAFIPHGGSSDYHAANIFDPCIVEHPSDPTKLVLYASGQGDDTGAPGFGHHSIGRWVMDKATPLATPTLSGVVLDEGPGWDACDHGLRLGSVLKVGSTYYMYYVTQNTGAAGNSIGVATSTDGIAWTKQGSALLTPSDDETALGEPAIWWEGGVATIIYSYRTSSAVLPAYRFATSSSLTGPFTKGTTVHGEKDILRRWRPNLHVEAHQIVKKNGRYYLLCEVGGNISDATPYRLYLASCDTVAGRYQWEKLILAENPAGTTGVDDKFHVATVGYYQIEGTDYLYWTGAPDKAQPYGENHWNMYAGPISGLFDELPES